MHIALILAEIFYKITASCTGLSSWAYVLSYERQAYGISPISKSFYCRAAVSVTLAALHAAGPHAARRHGQASIVPVMRT